MRLKQFSNTLTTIALSSLLAVSAQAATIQLGGRIHVDYSQGDDGADDTEDFEFRRVRLAAKGDVAEDWRFKVQVEFDTDAEDFDAGDDTAATNENDAEETDFKDVYFRYRGFGNMANITVGQQKEPFSLQALTSSNDITLLSTSPTIGLLSANDRNLGVQVQGSDGTFHYGAGIFRDKRETRKGGSKDILWALTGRAAYSPINDEDQVVHIALGITDREGGDYGSHTNGINLEGAWVTGPFSVQGEITRGEIGSNDAEGLYVQGAWTLTGERRPYKGGKFKRIKPQQAVAWEVAARLFGQSVDADTGGDIDTDGFALGINAYIGNQVKIGAQYIDADTDAPGQRSIDTDEFRLRGQLVF